MKNKTKPETPPHHQAPENTHPPHPPKAPPSPRHLTTMRTPRSRPAPAPLPQPITDPVESARAAGLRYVSDTRPGIRRKKFRAAFRYLNPDGSPCRDPKTLARIKSLVIPPAWADVWISPLPNGHLQATGRDAKGRKQSRYHPRWREVRDETKYERMALFARALPRIREQVEQDLALPGLPRPKVLATIVRLMETTHIRVGNPEYARDNGSYGLTTMRNRHVDVKGSTITFTFQGKSRVHHTINLQDRRLATIIKRCADIPGYELFQYLDADGERHSIDSADVNDYLHQVTGEHYTAKDFRTWAGSVLAHDLLRELGPFTSATEAKKNIVQAIKTVANRLGNTPSVCRKCYVHPAVLEAYMGGISPEAAKKKLDDEIADRATTLRHEEQALIDLLQQRLLLET
ncbi:MAG TPA: DNA topoisomerase IB [Acidobacteriaceae bacterium]